MALAIELPIYKLAYDLLSLAIDLTRNMPRDFKASLGSHVRLEAVALMVAIGKANAARDKTATLDALLEHLQVVELLMRVSHDKKFISAAQWARSVELTERIGKQAGGWRRWAKSEPQPRPLHDGHGRHA